MIDDQCHHNVLLIARRDVDTPCTQHRVSPEQPTPIPHDARMYFLPIFPFALFLSREKKRLKHIAVSYCPLLPASMDQSLVTV